ncbi:hypothetical protein B0J13DRAFT_657370 [Dactylonectria estremocensis]|uniref:Uncharacterized protein n=1 Tax=Dactylonectria estremocensis TaxID=1079267 RepID=A0A9P9IB60_9HYPO|nr:hypothetical protein B0J13DRAFT_657370 [Dactylonectria estremocensis]
MIPVSLVRTFAPTQYSLSITYDTINFFTLFNFFNEKDPTNSFIKYIGFKTAISGGLASDRPQSDQGRFTIYVGVNTTTVSPASSRKSVHFFRPNWPISREIDIIKGVNTQVHNTITLHTGSSCYIINEGTLESTTLLKWGLLTARFNGGSSYNIDVTGHVVCADRAVTIDTYFINNNLVFNTTFYRDWASSAEIWNTNLKCSTLSSNCNNYIAANPAAFNKAYWLINSIKIFN